MNFHGGEYNFSSMIYDEQNGFEYATLVSDSGYCIEYLWPKKTMLGKYEDNNMNRFRFDIGVYDWAPESSVNCCRELWWFRGTERNWEQGEFCGIVELKESKLGTKQVEELKNIFLKDNRLMLGNYCGAVSIYNILGKVVFSGKSVNQSVDLSGIKDGFYVVQIEGRSIKFTISR